MSEANQHAAEIEPINVGIATFVPPIPPLEVFFPRGTIVQGCFLRDTITRALQTDDNYFSVNGGGELNRFICWCKVRNAHRAIKTIQIILKEAYLLRYASIAHYDPAEQIWRTIQGDMSTDWQHIITVEYIEARHQELLSHIAAFDKAMDEYFKHRQ